MNRRLMTSLWKIPVNRSRCRACHWGSRPALVPCYTGRHPATAPLPWWPCLDPAFREKNLSCPPPCKPSTTLSAAVPVSRANRCNWLPVTSRLVSTISAQRADWRATRSKGDWLLYDSLVYGVARTCASFSCSSEVVRNICVKEVNS